MRQNKMDLKIDFAFKQMFGQKAHADLLIDFLNALLYKNLAEPITSLEFPNTEFGPAYDNAKGSRLDVYVVTSSGEQINIEIQLANEHNMVKRTLYYWSLIYREQIAKNIDYGHLKKSITVNILNFRYLDSTDAFHTTYHVYEDEHHNRLSDVLEIHFVEMPKFRKAFHGKKKEACQDTLGKWLMLLDASEDTEIQKELEVVAMTDSRIQEALNVWEEISRDPDNWAAYISRHKFIVDEISAKAERQRLEADKQRLETEKQRLEAELAKSNRQAAFIVSNLIQKGMSIADISAITGLSEEEVEVIRKQLN